MDFLEFLVKKKIDRVLFNNAQPELYQEFEREYAQMGPKSFDHSKKFLFNKLRRAYHLKAEPKPAKPPPPPPELASQAESLESPTIEQKLPYVPRFKSPAAPAAENPANEAPAKPAFKPRFKPSMVKQAGKPAADEPVAEEKLVAEEKPKTEEEVPKSAYKPKFSMKNIKPKDAGASGDGLAE
jgi:hypothetical protein